MYCFIISCGINLSIPKILFHIPEGKNFCQYKIDILADVNFNEKERKLVLKGIKSLEEFSNGKIILTVDFSLTKSSLIKENSSLLLKIDGKNIIAKIYDKQFNTKILGLCQFLSKGGTIVYIIPSRIKNDIAYYSTIAHEFGHYFGMDHINYPSIMHAFNYANIPYFTYLDAVEFSRINKCEISDLKFLKYIN